MAHTRSTRQTGHWSRRPEWTRSRQVQRQNKSMFKHGTGRLSAVQRTDKEVNIRYPTSSPVQPLAASLNQRPAGQDRRHGLHIRAWKTGESQDVPSLPSALPEVTRGEGSPSKHQARVRTFPRCGIRELNATLLKQADDCNTTKSEQKALQ